MPTLYAYVPPPAEQSVPAGVVKLECRLSHPFHGPSIACEYPNVGRKKSKLIDSLQEEGLTNA